jgi:anti-sigma B factor antagonist
MSRITDGFALHVGRFARGREPENPKAERGGMPPHFSCVFQMVGGVQYAHLSGELDVAHRGELIRLLTSATGSTLIADLSDLTFLDAAGLSALLSAKRQIEGAGGRFEVRGARGSVRYLFEMTDLELLLDD